MSNRTLIELNHDYCPNPRDDAALLDWARAMVRYMGGADPADLPQGVVRKHFRHHSEPCPMEAGPTGGVTAADLIALRRHLDRAAEQVSDLQGKVISTRSRFDADTFALAGDEVLPGYGVAEALDFQDFLVPVEVHAWAIVRRVWAVRVPIGDADGNHDGDEIMEFATKDEAEAFVKSVETPDATE
ncbi:hypothetical protein EOD42_13895 [Rhodovarius crocodyli]|uniref:Uncharacterized protein n=1 Tax=Rhodovarius crocodyli TaxID=1979269 RepID=A0A437MEX0_9PROT|nr:hypothetical protein [Rhodovarius crocodyli]RVT96204.1 hypothetical protein EOD42_13895 [Rhodovarius crocodyli]